LPKIAIADQLPKPVAYVLAGGASFGSVQVGQLRALARTDLSPDMVVGTSVGSINGAVVADDPTVAADRLAALWSTVVREDVFGKTLDTAVRVAKRSPALIDNASLKKFIESALESRLFSDLAIPLTAVATDFEVGEAVPMREGDLVSALMASAAIPAVFPKIEREGRVLVDGGVVANVPIAIAAAQGAQTIVVLDCGFTVIAPQKEDTLVSILLRTAAIVAAQQVRKDLQAVADRTVLYLPGPWPIVSRPDDFGRSEELSAAAYDLCNEWLTGLRISGPGRYGAAPADALSKPV